MHMLELTDAERELLDRFLENSLRMKRVEIHRTDSSAFRAELEQEEQMLTQLVERLRHCAV